MWGWAGCGRRSINEVLQFLLIWLGALLMPILGLIEAGGWTNLKAQIAAAHGHHGVHPPVDARPAHFKDNPMGIHWTGLVFGLGWSSAADTGPRIFWWCSACCRRTICASARMAPIIGAGFKMVVPFIVILPGLLALACCPIIWFRENAGGGHRAAQLQRSAAADAGALLRAGLAGAGRDGADRGIHVAAWRAT